MGDTLVCASEGRPTNLHPAAGSAVALRLSYRPSQLLSGASLAYLRICPVKLSGALPQTQRESHTSMHLDVHGCRNLFKNFSFLQL